MEDLPGLAARPVDRWLRGTLPGLMPGGGWTAEVISGGLSNLTYRLRLPGGTVILRRPPLGHVLPRAHDMAREHRVLSALAHSPVPVPAPLAFCADLDVLGVPFYVMPDVPGRVLRQQADSEALRSQDRAALADALIRTLADLHAIDPDEAGLGDYGQRADYNARQLRTWRRQWDRSRTRDLPDMDTLIDKLAADVPPDSGSVIVHGDFRLDNAVVDLTGPPRIAAVLDWELSTLGDPLADLGVTLTYWHDLGDAERAMIPVAVGLTALPGFPTGRELASRYSTLTGRDLGGLPFYRALGAMKLAVILEGVHSRYLGRQSIGEGYATAGTAVPVLVARGLSILAGRSA